MLHILLFRWKTCEFFKHDTRLQIDPYGCKRKIENRHYKTHYTPSNLIEI